MGDGRAAASFYQFALNIAPPPNQLPPDLRNDLVRAQDMRARYAGEFESFLRDRLAQRGLGDGRGLARFRQSIDILVGKRQIYFQEPQMYFFPELPQIQFYDREAFPWLDKVEAATADIRAELLEVMKEDSAFKPYVEHNPARPRKEQAAMTGNPDWSAFYLMKFGEIVPENAARCPRTMRGHGGRSARRRQESLAIGAVLAASPGRPNSTAFGTRQYPLDLPPAAAGPAGVRFRVGNDTRIRSKARHGCSTTPSSTKPGTEATGRA